MQSNTLFRAKTTVAKHLLQSPLFSASNKVTDEQKSLQTFKTYRGEILEVYAEPQKQFDLAVALAYKQIINQAKDIHDVHFNLGQFAKSLYRKDGGKTRKFIMAALERNRSMYIRIKNEDGHIFEGNRLSSFEEEDIGNFKVQFNEEYMQYAYVEKNVCHIDMQIFLSLPLGLCSWLYGFMCSEPSMRTCYVDMLHDLSGSNYRSVYDFRKMLKYAMRHLELNQVIHRCWGVRRTGELFWEFRGDDHL